VRVSGIPAHRARPSPADRHGRGAPGGRILWGPGGSGRRAPAATLATAAGAATGGRRGAGRPAEAGRVWPLDGI